MRCADELGVGNLQPVAKQFLPPRGWALVPIEMKGGPIAILDCFDLPFLWCIAVIDSCVSSFD